MQTRSLIIAGGVALAALACRNEPTAPTAGISRVESAVRPLEGWFHIVWVDPSPPGGPGLVRYNLVDAQGHGTELDLDPGLATRWGGPRGLDRRKVRVDGHSVAGGRLRVRSIEPVAGPAGAEPLAVQVGSHPFVTILCKFSDMAYEPFPMATYLQWTTGTTYPSLDHYWRELSYNQMNVSGSVLVGWYTLPYPKSYYYDSGTGNLAFDELATDCTTAADPQVNFPRFYGINLQFNGGGFGSYSAFGGSWTLTADGQTKTYGMTWLGGSSLYIYAHEGGHTLGLPHSSGPYDQTYDSHWDVMSGLAGLWSAHPVVPVHAISYHKNLLGWIPAARKLTVGPNTSRTITLERLALPSPGNFLLAEIPMDNAPGLFYTVEARRRVSYDDSIPGNAVLLHRVDPNPNWDRQARVVDVDNNGNPNDAAAMWTPGETFTDAANGITVTVNARTATGFQVTIKRGAAGAWAGRASMPTARRALAVAVANGLVYAIGGANGSGTVLRTVQAYSPSANAWTTRAALPAPRQGGNGAVTINGIVYLAGGEDAAGGLTRTLYAYNASTNVWSTRAAMPAYGACGGSAVIAGKLYVFSGCTRSSTGARIDARLLHRYNPTSNTWTTLKAAPVTHFRPVVGAISGKLYVVGGNDSSGVAMRRVDMYDPATNTWSIRTGMPTARMNAGATSAGGKLYVIGGRNTAYLNTVEAYDPVSNAWTSGAAMPTARTALGVGNASGLLYAIGGRNPTPALATSERFTP
jgi:M6 family metalloprotease-like protein